MVQIFQRKQRIQSLSGTGPIMLFHNFTNDNSLSIWINNDIGILKELRLKPGSTTVLNTGYLILKSDRVNTANVAKFLKFDYHVPFRPFCG